MKKNILIALFMLLGASLFIQAGRAPSIKEKPVTTQETVYGVVPKGKYWILYSAENRSAAGQFYYINNKPIDAIYTGGGCHPYCFKSWLPDGKKLFAGESVGVKDGNGIVYIYNEYSDGGVK